MGQIFFDDAWQIRKLAYKPKYYNHLWETLAGPAYRSALRRLNADGSVSQERRMTVLFEQQKPRICEKR